MKRILCSSKDNIYKAAHGIYSQDYDHIVSQLLCGLPKKYLNNFIRNFIDTKLYL